MTDCHFMTAPRRTSEPHARVWIFGALLCGAASLATAADVTVQPVAGSGFVVKDSGGATDRFRVQDNGQVSLPAVPAASTRRRACASATGLLGPCAGGGGTYSAGTGLSLTGSTFSVSPPYQLPQACASNQIPQWNGSTWICGSGGRSPVGGSGTAGFLPVWTGTATLANSVVTQVTSGNVGIDVTGAPANRVQLGDTPGFSGNELALGKGVAAMSFALTSSGPSGTATTGFLLKSTVGDASSALAAVRRHNLDVFGSNAQIALVNTSNGTSATISKYTNRLE